MKKTNKIMLASLAMAFAFAGGAVALNASADGAPVLEGLTVENGMSIRTNAPEGLRFKTTVAMSDSEYAASGITEIGMVLMPESQVTGELTIDEKKGDVEALLIPTQNWIVEEDENSKSFYSVLVNTGLTGEFPEAFYNTPITARAYAKYGDEVKYSANSVTRSIGYVAALTYMSGGEGADSATVGKIAQKTSLALDINGGEALTTKNTDGYEAKLVVGNVTAEDYENVSVIWSVEGDAVSVDENGVVTALKAGTATVTATIGGQIPVSQEVTVAGPEVKITMGNQVALVGQAVAPVVSVTVDGEPVEATLAFTSGNDSLFTVADGKMTGVAHGETTVTATYEGVSAQAKVTVFDKAIYDTSDFLAITGDSWYILATDIDFAEVDYTEISSFSGLLDGNGYALKNISMYADSNNYTYGASMFDTLSGTIRRLAIMNVFLDGAWNGGGNMLGQSSLIAYTFSGVLEDVYIGGKISGIVAVDNPWTQYTGWGLRAGVIAQNSQNGLLTDVILDVEVDSDSGLMGIATGTVRYGHITVVPGKNVSGSWSDNNIVESGAWVGELAVSNGTSVWPAFNIGETVWNVQEGVMAELIPNCTGVVPAKVA